MSLNQAMNFAESSGESSSSGRENGAASLDTERPHKKARFPWQIKGKHHLKNQTDSQTDIPANSAEEQGPVTPPPELDIPIITPLTPPPEIYVPPDIATFGLGALSGENRGLIWSGPGGADSDGSTSGLNLQTVISLAESMLLRSSYDCTDFAAAKNELKLIMEREFNTSPGPSKSQIAPKANKKKLDEDRCIALWQTDQTSKGCYDNNINRLIESWLSGNISAEDRHLVLDFARIMSELPQYNNNVENEAIQMAINYHGLQNMPTHAGPPFIAFSGQLERTLASDVPICEESDSSCSDDIPSDREDYYRWDSDENNSDNEDSSDNENNSDNENQDQISNEETNDFGLPWKHENISSNQPEPCQSPVNNNSSTEEYEFLNTAIIQAIKTKGLLAAGTDFG